MQGFVDILPIGVLLVTIALTIVLLAVLLKLRKLNREGRELVIDIEEGTGL